MLRRILAGTLIVAQFTQFLAFAQSPGEIRLDLSSQSVLNSVKFSEKAKRDNPILSTFHPGIDGRADGASDAGIDYNQYMGSENFKIGMRDIDSTLIEIEKNRYGLKDAVASNNKVLDWLPKLIGFALPANLSTPGAPGNPLGEISMPVLKQLVSLGSQGAIGLAEKNTNSLWNQMIKKADELEYFYRMNNYERQGGDLNALTGGDEEALAREYGKDIAHSILGTAEGFRAESVRTPIERRAFAAHELAVSLKRGYKNGVAVERNAQEIAGLVKEFHEAKANGVMNNEKDLAEFRKIAEIAKFKASDFTNAATLLQEGFINKLKALEAAKDSLLASEKPNPQLVRDYDEAEKHIALLATIVNQPANLNNPEFMAAFSKLAGLDKVPEPISEQLRQQRLSDDLKSAQEWVDASQALFNLGYKMGVVDTNTYKAVSASLTIITGGIQIAASSGHAAPIVLAVVMIVAGLVSLFGDSPQSNNGLEAAVKQILENQQKIFMKLDEVERLMLDLHTRMVAYLQSEFDMLEFNNNLSAIRDNDAYLTNRFAQCEDFIRERALIARANESASPLVQYRKITEHFSRENYWGKVTGCTDEILRLLSVDSMGQVPVQFLVIDALHPDVNSDHKGKLRDIFERQKLLTAHHRYWTEFGKPQLNDDSDSKSAAVFYPLRIGVSSLSHLDDKLAGILSLNSGSETYNTLALPLPLDPFLLTRLSGYIKQLMPWVGFLEGPSAQPVLLTADQVTEKIAKYSGPPGEATEKLFPHAFKLSRVVSLYRDAVDAAVAQQSLMDGDITLPRSWEILTDQLDTLAKQEFDRPGDDDALSRPYESLRALIQDNGAFASNLMLFGVRHQIDAVLKDPEIKQEFLNTYQKLCQSQDPEAFTAHIRKVFPLKKRGPMNPTNPVSMFEASEVQVISYSSYQTQVTLKILERRKDVLRQRIARYQNKPEFADRDGRRDMAIYEELESNLRDIKRKMRSVTALKIEAKNPRFFIKLPGAVTYIPIPTVAELAVGTFTSSMPMIYGLQDQSRNLDWNYSLPGAVKSPDSVKAMLSILAPAL